MIAIKIDLDKMDEALLFEGKKGTYLNITLKDNREGKDQYGNDGFVTQDVSAEERKAGVKGPIIGNWKHVGTGSLPRRAPTEDEEGQPQRRYGSARPERPAPAPRNRPVAQRPPPRDPDLEPGETEDDIPFNPNDRESP